MLSAAPTVYNIFRKFQRDGAWEEIWRSSTLAKPMNGINAPQRPDCVAGHIRLELGNVVANYPVES